MNIKRCHYLFELILIGIIMPWIVCNATDGQAKAELTTVSPYKQEQQDQAEGTQGRNPNSVPLNDNDDQTTNQKIEKLCCPRGWTVYQEPDERTILKCVKIIFDWNATYPEFEKRCSKEGGWPASIHGRLQNVIIKRMAQAQRIAADIGGNPELVPNYVSIGLTDQRPQSLQSQNEDIALYSQHNHSQDWFWLDRSTVDYTHWQKGYPKVSQQPRCAVMVTKPEDSPAYGFWRDFDCEELRAPFVCQVQSCNCDLRKQYYCPA